MSETDKKINIQVVNEQGKPVLVEFREGQLPEIRESVAYEDDVSMSSIVDYVHGKEYEQKPKDNTGVVTFCLNPDKVSLKFDENPKDDYATVLRSVLTVHPDYAAFGINKGKKFDQKSLEQHFMKYSHCFPDVAECKALVSSLRNFAVKYEQEVERSDSRRGEKADTYKEALKFSKGELPETIVFKMPYFLGTEPKEIKVEVEIDKGQGNMPMFSFWSLALEADVRTEALAYVNEHVAELKKFFVCLEKL